MLRIRHLQLSDSERVCLARPITVAIVVATLFTACRQGQSADDQVPDSTVISEAEKNASDGVDQLAISSPGRTVLAQANNAAAAQVLAWAGSSYLGYVRAELWVSESEALGSTLELRVIYADGKLHKHCGKMIPIPSDFAPAGGPWKAFVTETDQRYTSPYPAFLASVNASGMMRLYEFGGPDGIAACDLQPVR
jgi:hypothetical protein